jgi:MFS family permease
MYVGGFLGPFGGLVVVPMLPEVAAAFGTSVQTVAWSLTVYTLPLALLMQVSGTLADVWGRARTVRAAYLVYAAASLACAAAPSTELFFGARMLQGSANAFTTPLLVAALYDAVARERLGRSLGRFGGMQAAGMAFAPLAGGLAGALDWRLGFVAIAAVAGALALVPPRAAHRAPAQAGSLLQRWRSLGNVRLVRACAVALLFNLTAAGAVLLISLLAADRFGLGPGQRGLVIACYGAAGLLLSPVLGHLVDRYGPRRTGVGVFALLAGVVAAAAWAPTVAALAVASALSGAAATGSRVVVNSLSVTSTPANPGGAASMTMSWLFLGSALAPLLFLPAYSHAVVVGFLLTASAAAAASILAVPRLAPPVPMAVDDEAAAITAVHE